MGLAWNPRMGIPTPRSAAAAWPSTSIAAPDRQGVLGSCTFASASCLGFILGCLFWSAWNALGGSWSCDTGLGIGFDPLVRSHVGGFVAHSRPGQPWIVRWLVPDPVLADACFHAGSGPFGLATKRAGMILVRCSLASLVWVGFGLRPEATHDSLAPLVARSPCRCSHGWLWPLVRYFPEAWRVRMLRLACPSGVGFESPMPMARASFFVVVYAHVLRAWFLLVTGWPGPDFGLAGHDSGSAMLSQSRPGSCHASRLS
jgi:hypothetical protein